MFDIKQCHVVYYVSLYLSKADAIHLFNFSIYLLWKATLYKLPYSRTSVNVLQKHMNDKCTYDKSVIHKHVNNASKTLNMIIMLIHSFIHNKVSTNQSLTYVFFGSTSKLSIE